MSRPRQCGLHADNDPGAWQSLKAPSGPLSMAGKPTPVLKGSAYSIAELEALPDEEYWQRVVERATD